MHHTYMKNKLAVTRILINVALLPVQVVLDCLLAPPLLQVALSIEVTTYRKYMNEQTTLGSCNRYTLHGVST